MSEISRSAADAAHHTAQVSDSVANLTRMSGEAGVAATQVLSASGDLARQSDTLRGDVGGFIAGIRAA
jgi:methyl-accepting chemotaxis protein